MTLACRRQLALLTLLSLATKVHAQAEEPQHRPRGTAIRGLVREAPSARVLGGVTIAVEGTALVTLSDSVGRYFLASVPPGPQVLQARRFGYAPARVAVVVPLSGTVSRDIEIARLALQMPQVSVSADPVSRARGELGTATVVTREAISSLGAPTLAGVLELLPGVPLQPPGLDNVQQIPLRSVPTFSGEAERQASFGTLIVMDGVPISNNANLQSTGPRGEIVPATPAGGGIDLRRIPAAAIERVEVIRGVPSARYGDLTNGAIIVDTRAGIIPAEVLGRYDPQTSEVNFTGGWGLSPSQNASVTADVARTLLAPGLRSAAVWRGTLDFAHRIAFAGAAGDAMTESRGVLDSRLSVYQLYENAPEEPDRPGRVSSNRSGGARLMARARWGAFSRPHIELTTAVDREWQNTHEQRLLVRGAEPFTSRLTPGRGIGHYVGGAYPATVRLRGAPWKLYSRIEGILLGTPDLTTNTFRTGIELRREWNAGPGYQFDIEFPPQVAFNGVNGYDRPRRFDAIPAVATTAAYVDDRWIAALPHDIGLDVQMGIRADLLHSGPWWASGSRSKALQPRMNVQVAPRSWLRFRTGWGTTAKVPSVANLYPAPQYYDVVNVNWYPPDSAERLAVLTTFVRDPANAQLRLAAGRKAEVGVEVDIGPDAAVSMTVFRDVTTGAVAFRSEPGFLLREHFALTDSTLGTGRPPGYVTPAQATDTVPTFLDRPQNLNRIENSGLELTVSLPQISPIRTRIELLGAWTVSRLSNDAVEFGAPNRVSDFQLDSLRKRLPYWTGNRERGERAMATARLSHHQPAIGLVITGIIQGFIRESVVQEGATDTLAWSGYLTRSGALIAVPTERRGDPQFADLRRPRFGLLTVPQSPPADWLFSLQVAKTIFGDGRLSFYAFNALDRPGRPATTRRAGRIFQRLRFGIEISLPAGVPGRPS